MNPLLIRRRGMMANEAVPQDGQLEWIETDGVAYIDTGIIGADPKSCELQCLVTTTSFNPIIGSYGTATRSYFMLVQTNNGYVGFEHYYGYMGGDGSPSISQSISNQTPFIVKCAMRRGAQNMQVKQEGDASFTTFSKANNNSISTGYSMSLLGKNTHGTVAPSLIGTRCYYAKIYGNYDYTGLVRDYVPWRLNGEVGLMDTLTDTFYGNAAGSGAFTGGPNVI